MWELDHASWPAYRFLRRQVRWSGIPISVLYWPSKNRVMHTYIAEGSIPNPPIQMLLLLLLSRVSRVWLCKIPYTEAHQIPLSLGFSRQEHWSGLPFPSPMHKSGKWKGSCSGLTCIISLKKQEGSRKTSTSALLTTSKPLTVWITTNCGKFLKRWNTRRSDLPPEKSVCR